MSPNGYKLAKTLNHFGALHNNKSDTAAWEFQPVGKTTLSRSFVASATRNPARLLEDFDGSVRRDQVEELDDIPVVHAYAPNGPGNAHLRAVGAAMQVDVPAHGVDVSQAVEAGLAAGKPQDAGQYPVA